MIPCLNRYYDGKLRLDGIKFHNRKWIMFIHHFIKDYEWPFMAADDLKRFLLCIFLIIYIIVQEVGSFKRFWTKFDDEHLPATR